jgi:superfamily II DNA or RNA helicase
MKFKISEDKNFLILDDSTALEYDQICSSFTKKIDNWYIIKRKKPYWDCEIHFMDRYNRIPKGLWGEVKTFAKKFNFPLQIEGTEYIWNHDFKEDEFDEWVEQFFPEPINPEDFYPRPYQIESCKRGLKFRLCTQEISTSGGKTLIAYMIFRYLFDKGIIKSMLYVVPNVDLIGQTEEKFYLYEDISGHKPNWKSQCVFSGASKKQDKDPNIIFGTYQSLCKRGPEYFEKFDMVLIDETHHAKANSIQNILVKCFNAQYKIGLTGTLPPEGSCSSFTIQSYLGPKVYTIASSDLINEGRATPVNVVCIELDYLSEEKKKSLYDLRDVKTDEKDGVKLLNLEKELARDSRKRLVYICEMIQKTKKNTLVLFADIKHEYGRKIYNWLRENSDKSVYYIDGGTKLDNRDFYKEKMEKDEDVVLVASTGVFSEGIDLVNIHNLFITESSKSEIIVRQMLGRPMRLMSGKDKVIVMDFSDNYFWNGPNKFQRKNYLMRHSLERERIYKEKKFPFKRFKIRL